MTDCLHVEREGGTVTLTLNRPDKLNSLDHAMVEALISAIAEASTPQTRLLVIRGEGKGFCGGFDLSRIDSETEGDLVLRFLRIEQLLQAIYHAPFLTLALVHGACFGAGADIAASCSYRIATSDARFRMPGLKFGVVLGTRRLAKLVGRDNARDLLLSPKPFGAAEALRVNFLTATAEQSEWPQTVVRCEAAAQALAASGHRALLRATTDDTRDADLAELARSVAVPGLKQRIQNYMQGVLS